MMWFKKLLRKWMLEASREPRNAKNDSILEAIAGAKPHNQLSGDAQLTVALRKALNGHILELGVWASNPRGPDWTYSHFIVPEGESVPDAIAAVLVNHRLNK